MNLFAVSIAHLKIYSIVVCSTESIRCITCDSNIYSIILSLFTLTAFAFDYLFYSTESFCAYTCAFECILYSCVVSLVTLSLVHSNIYSGIIMRSNIHSVLLSLFAISLVDSNI